jgi:hypothetical protein
MEFSEEGPIINPAESIQAKCSHLDLAILIFVMEE